MARLHGGKLAQKCAVPASIDAEMRAMAFANLRYAAALQGRKIGSKVRISHGGGHAAVPVGSAGRAV
jgi:hypothetical protein